MDSPTKLTPGKLGRNLLHKFGSVDEVPVKPKRVGFEKKKISSYGHLKIFQKPAQLVRTDDKTFRAVEDTLRELSEIDDPVSVVAMVGMCRSGKSTTLNKIAGKQVGFDVCETVESKTKGIWIWCQNHPDRRGHILLLLDTEGIGDIRKGDKEHDKWIFLLACLLCSTFILNVEKQFDEYSLQRMSFLKSISKSIHVDDDPDNDSLLDFFFPTLTVVVQSHTLQLKTRTGKRLSGFGHDYLEEYCLALKEGDDDDTKDFNELRYLIREYFKNRTCFTLPPPSVDDQVLMNLGKQPDDKLNPKYVANMKELVSYVQSAPSKQFKSGIPIKGRMFGSLVMNFVAAIKGGAVPRIQTAMKYMVDIENQQVLASSIKIYREAFEDKMGRVREDYQAEALQEIHDECRERALDYLTDNMVLDDNQIALREANQRFSGLLQQFQMKLQKAAEERAKQVLTGLYRPIQSRLQRGSYSGSEGKEKFANSVSWLIEQFAASCGLEGKNKNILDEFMQDMQEDWLKMERSTKETQSDDKTAARVESFKRHNANKVSEMERKSRVYEQNAFARAKAKSGEEEKKRIKQLRDCFDELQIQRQQEYERQERERTTTGAATIIVSRSKRDKPANCPIL